MRNGLSLLIIALALASIVAGFLSGQSASHPPPTVVLHPARVPSPQPDVSADPDTHVDDLFSGDDVVVDRPLARLSNWLPERLEIVVGLCGRSVAVESGFLRLGYPIAFDLDPNGAEAVKFAQVARGAGNLLYVHVDSAPSRAQIDALRTRLGPFDGIASRAPARMAKALERTGLAFFDERGDADAAPFAHAGVSLLRRDVTADNHTEATYVTYMLAHAAARSRRAGATVVLLRPFPSSLSALTHFAASRTIELAALR